MSDPKIDSVEFGIALAFTAQMVGVGAAIYLGADPRVGNGFATLTMTLVALAVLVWRVATQ